MTEQERFTIEKDLVNEKLCVWDYDDLICEIDDNKALIKLIDILNKQDTLINKLTELKDKYSHSMLDVEEVNETLRKENKALKEKLCELGVSDVKWEYGRIDTGLGGWLNEDG